MALAFTLPVGQLLPIGHQPCMELIGGRPTLELRDAKPLLPVRVLDLTLYVVVAAEQQQGLPCQGAAVVPYAPCGVMNHTQSPRPR